MTEPQENDPAGTGAAQPASPGTEQAGAPAGYPQYQQYPVPAGYQQMPPGVYVQQKPKRTMSQAGMVLGIVAWAVSLLSVFILSPLSLVMSIVGLPLSIIGLRKEPEGRGMAITGIILNSLGIAMAVILGIITIIGWVSSEA